MKKVSVKLKGNLHQYEIKIGHSLLNVCGDWARKSLSNEAKKITIVTNAKVFGLYGEIVKSGLEKSNFEVLVCKIGDGERYKSFHTLEKTLKFLSENKLKRTDAVVALGGGVVGDLAGFAASIYLRGVSFLQIPTTLLAMIDSSVGGKTAVNTEFGKNLIGTFYQPNGVLIDIETLKTLPRRELVAGFCEAVKQGAIADQNLFDQTAEFLENHPLKNFKKHFLNLNFLTEIENLLAAQVAFKAKVVINDERESAQRTDAKSRKILNFGHTLAHALEKITDYKYFKHGEAVGYGILFAADLSKMLDIFDENELKSLNDVLHRVGKLPDTKNIEIKKIIEAFAFDKKAIGDSLQFILLEGIGKPVILQNKDIPASKIQKSLETVLHK
ncbi:MAG: 3-dehydroquinate synthase [Acidobacteriota bacterium]